VVAIGGLMVSTFLTLVYVPKLHSLFDELKEKGHVTRARLGVHITDVDKETMKALGLKDRHGALVPQVEAGSAADKAGIRAGDVIISIDGELIRKAHDLPIRVARHTPGDKVKVGIIRDGKQRVLSVTVEAMPDDQVARGDQPKQDGSNVRLGMVVENLSADMAARLRTRVKTGVMVQQVQQGMPAANAGIQRGDVIFRINGKDLPDMKTFSKLAKTFKHGEVLRVMMDRRGDQVFALVKLPQKSD